MGILGSYLPHVQFNRKYMLSWRLLAGNTVAKPMLFQAKQILKAALSVYN